MRPGERVDLIRRLADQLSQQLDLPEADFRLVMRGFGVNTYGSIEPDARTWVLPRLEDVTDEQLVELDEYLLAGPSRQLLDPADLPWESGTFHLFVSHTHTRARLAGKMRVERR